MLFAGDAYVPYAIVTVRRPDDAGSRAHSVDPHVDGRIMGAGSLHSAVGAAVWSGRASAVAIGLGLMCVVLLPTVPPALAIAAWAVA
jgi:hypothetical protein